MKNTDPRDPIPEDFQSEDEAAEFWDAHSLAGYEEQLESCEVDVDLQKRHFEIEVDEEVFKVLSERARSSHKSIKDLASKLLQENLPTA